MNKQKWIGFGILAAGLVVALGGAILSVNHSNYFFLAGQVLGLAAAGVFIYRFAGDDDKEPTPWRTVGALAASEGQAEMTTSKETASDDTPVESTSKPSEE